MWPCSLQLYSKVRLLLHFSWEFSNWLRKKRSFFGKFGMLYILVTSVLRFALLPYYRQIDCSFEQLWLACFVTLHNKTSLSQTRNHLSSASLTLLTSLSLTLWKLDLTVDIFWSADRQLFFISLISQICIKTTVKVIIYSTLFRNFCNKFNNCEY